MFRRASERHSTLLACMHSHILMRSGPSSEYFFCVSFLRGKAYNVERGLHRWLDLLVHIRRDLKPGQSVGRQAVLMTIGHNVKSSIA